MRLTMAATMQTEPRWQGLRKCTLSTLAVTQGPPATDFAASPAQMSIQLSTCSSRPRPQPPDGVESDCCFCTYLTQAAAFIFVLVPLGCVSIADFGRGIYLASKADAHHVHLRWQHDLVHDDTSCRHGEALWQWPNCLFRSNFCSHLHIIAIPCLAAAIHAH